MNNKKFIGIIILSVFILGGIVWRVFFYVTPTLAEEILPNHAMAFIRVSDWHLNKEIIFNNAFANEIKRIDIPKVLMKNNVPQKDIDAYNKTVSDINRVINDQMFNLFISREVAIAFYPDKNKQDDGSVVVLSRLTPQARLAQMTGQAFVGLKKNVTIADVPNEKPLKVLTFSNNPKKIYFWIFQDWMIAVDDNLDLARQMLNKIEGNGLLANHSLQWIKQKAYVQDDFFMFFDMGLYLEHKASFLDKQSLEFEEFNKFMRESSGFSSYGVSWKNGDPGQLKFMIALDKTKMIPSLRQLFDCKPMVNESGRIVPSSGVLMYQWGNCYDFKAYWQNIREQLQADEPKRLLARDIRRKIEKRFDINIEKDVLPLFGHDMGGYLAEIDTSTMFPYPRLLGFIRILDKAKVQDLIDKVMAQSPVDFEKHSYQNIDIFSTKLPLGSNTDPAYCFLGDYLLVASSQQLIRKSIDAFMQEGKGFINAKIFKDLKGDSNALINGLVFIKWDDVSSRIKELAQWGNKWLSSQVAMAKSFKTENEALFPEFEQNIAMKKQELTFAQKKIKELQERVKTLVAGSVELEIESEKLNNLLDSGNTLSQEILAIEQERDNLALMIKEYDEQANNAKVMIMNIDQVLMPILNALGSVKGQLVNIIIDDRGIVNEIVFK